MLFEKISYQGWPNCYRLTNGEIELILTGDVGARVMRFGFVGGKNVFHEYPETLGMVGGDAWRLYGGHRLWHAPESIPRTYFPDNFPVQVEQRGDTIHVVQPLETTTGIEKEMEFTLDAEGTHVRVVHRLRNRNLWTVPFAVWALSVTATGSKAIVPLPPRGTHDENLDAANTLTMWAYTDMTDPRWTWGRKYILLQQDARRPSSQKLGVANAEGWVAAANFGNLFVKTFDYVRGAEYPDFGSSIEVYADGVMLEVETLGPTVSVAPGAAVEHVENWFLLRGVPMPMNDTDIDASILPKVAPLLRQSN